ncbi:MAG: enterotoxin, partial [Planctomycetota bacterium]
ADGRLKPVCIVDKLSGTNLALGGAECFRFSVARSPAPDWQVVRASDLELARAPKASDVKSDDKSQRLADRFSGREIVVDLVSPDGKLEVEWHAVLRDGANYVRQFVLIKAKQEPIELREMVLIELSAPEAEVIGSVDGSPVVAGSFFFGCENPMSRNTVQPADAAAAGNVVRCEYPYNLTAGPDKPLELSCVVGVVPEGQLRRGFLHYLERERAQPYHPFLHHSCGYQVGCRFWSLRRYGKPEDWEQFVGQMEGLWLGLIDEFGRELVEKRGAVLDSFVHDHGWDNTEVVWQFHEGYPRGFAPQQAAAKKYQASVGVWLSPWGGYSGRARRVEAGQKQGFESYKMGLSLAGPHYYTRVREACLGMVRNYGVNYFKFDGFGSSNNQTGAGLYSSEVEALLRLSGEIRRAKPDVFLNPTTGTWPSPFWLLWADAIWRQESDAGFLGKGSDRQQWLTYRDNATYHGTIGRGPLYPISSLMLHGIMIHKFAFKGPYDPKNPPVSCQEVDVLAEIRSYFATGTNLQELHIDPSLMTEKTWDVLAESAKWSRINADVLADTHWVGGDPEKGETYGWASWSKRKGILALRNPSDQPSQITLDVRGAFELPAGAAQEYVLRSPWAADAAKPAITVSAGRPHPFKLQPFEVLVWDATPSQ